MQMVTKSFKGANVFLSRNLVPPEIFDAVHDSLKQNGAEVFLCCDPSRSGIDDYHVISSPDHEKFEDLKAKGCNLLGPHCVLSCAKENRVFPKQQGFTCCLAMDGVKVLASGFLKDEKVKIENLVTAMGGVFQTKASLDINFVIVKDVLSAKYKWALNILKKPIVTISWLYQCWTEHRVVPQEPYRVLPFSGLAICATRIPADLRKEMEKAIVQNGGQYSADLTKKCTHLVSDISFSYILCCILDILYAPEGDKYKVARKWGHIHIVTKKWLDQSITRKACLDEESYPVQGASVSSSGILKDGLKGKHFHDKSSTNSQSVPAPTAADLETTMSQNMSSTFSDSTIFTKDDEGIEAPTLKPEDEEKLDSCVADDSQTEDNGLYLSDCRILLVGFHATEMRKLVNMVRRGGGSRYMSFSEKLTHIVVGTPSENERKEVRRYAASAVIYVVRTVWLDDCDREKKEIPVSQRHIVSDLLLPRDSVHSNKASRIGTKQGKSSALSSMPVGHVLADMSFQSGMPQDKSEEKLATSKTEGSSVEKSSSNVFKGLVFRFSSSFPPDRRAEIVEWVKQGGGSILNYHSKQNAHFTVECHGLMRRPGDVSQTTIVSSHWIRSCLEDGCMPDVGSHIIYSPLPCRIPLPGFESFRFCVSQYEEKDRLLLRNLCFVLGAKFTEKLSRKVTHLLCKFTSGPKYEAACKWGIQSVTSEWISECIRQDAIASTHPFQPKEVTAQDREAGLCTMTQYTTQAARMVSGDVLPSQSQVATKIPTQSFGNRNNNLSEEAEYSSAVTKRARLSDNDSNRDLLPPDVRGNVSSCKMDTMKNSVVENVGDVVSHNVPDVAAAIEDLLAQSSKIQDKTSPGRTGSERNIFSPDHSILGQNPADSHSVIRISKNWLSRNEKQDDDQSNPSGQDLNQRTYDGFSETQTESQVVGYEEDLSGIQMIIERVRTRSSMT
ncbi:BRCT domain [Macleaya cordata]|uniref:BRCT domain n=1 Tax=Macleaya cordata TaxID=56857 RepID=A0A200QW22_MACCD|nr:BRCT domain [Macleaya cordata]